MSPISFYIKAEMGKGLRIDGKLDFDDKSR